MPIATTLSDFYDAMLAAYGPRGWWPGETRTEIVIGAILTQNTNWKNVERAISQLRAAGMLNWSALRAATHERLAELIRPAGYFNVKARRLRNFVEWLHEHHEGNLEALLDEPLDALREALLSINGIGPETADSILLYALDKPTFVVDAYTARIVRRHGLVDEPIDYHGLKSLMEDNLPADVEYYNEYHALIVEVGKRHCKPRAKCEGCPLERFPHSAEDS